MFIKWECLKEKNSPFWSALLFLATCIVSLKLFFSSTSLPESFQKDHVDWYLNYAKEVFHPSYFLKGAYFTESMLMPVLTNSLGAARSMAAYKIFCAILTILILPALEIFANHFFKNLTKTLFFLILFVISYSYFSNYILGFPDPLTIILLFWIAFEKNPIRLCFGVTLVCLSHFSLALLSLIGLMVMMFASPPLNRANKFALIKALIVGMIAGRIVLAGWHFVFDYHPSGRISWALGHGLNSFVERYEDNIRGFWTTPGMQFIGIYGMVFLYFLVHKKWAICAASICVLGLTFFGLFFTVDGYRIFAVIIAAPYAWFLKEFILDVSEKLSPHLLDH